MRYLHNHCYYCPIETFYSIQPVVQRAMESSARVTAVVYKSGDLTQASQVSVSTFMLCKYLKWISCSMSDQLLGLKCSYKHVI